MTPPLGVRTDVTMTSLRRLVTVARRAAAVILEAEGQADLSLYNQPTLTNGDFVLGT